MGFTLSALDKAQSRRSSLIAAIKEAQGRLDVLRRDLSHVEWFIAAHAAYSQGIAPPQPVCTADAQCESVSLKRTKGNSPKEEVASVACAIIKERGSPIKRSELLTLLRARGLVIGGKDPETVLGTMLWRQRHMIRRADGGGYEVVQ